MSWTHALQVYFFAGAFLCGVGIWLLQRRPWQRGNRRRRGVLPAPSVACRRNGPESCP